jgi:hypothetical protein
LNPQDEGNFFKCIIPIFIAAHGPFMRGLAQIWLEVQKVLFLFIEEEGQVPL